MKLTKFKEKNNRKKELILFTMICIFLIAGMFIYQSFALFETNENFNIVSGNTENPGDISFAFYVNDKIVLEAPAKNSGLALDEKSTCTNGVKLNWNVESWVAKLDYSSYQLENKSKTKCNLYFREATFADYVTSCGQNNTSVTECMKKYAGLDQENLMYDETTDNNLRYVGADPNNYVMFNDELWRVIGVMEQIDDGTGSKNSYLKITRSDSIGRYSWDTVEAELNNGVGINEWSQADLMKLLNPGYEDETVGGSLYWNQKSGTCYEGRYNETAACNFTETGINANSKNYIQEIIWHTGSNKESLSPGEIYTLLNSAFYELERSENVGKICNSGVDCLDTVARATTWKGHVGLIYPSDFVLSIGGSKENRETCLSSSPTDWKNLPYCKENTWLYKTEDHLKWTIAPANVINMANCAFDIRKDMFLFPEWTFGAGDIYPTLYLKKNTKFVQGEGTREKPYILL